MSRITPLPTTRLSNRLIRTRLAEQLQANQTELFRYQNQVSTGRRFFAPSEDPASALRASDLQWTLERKTQIQSNLQGANTYLAAAEAQVSSLSTVLNDIRGSALGVVDTVITEEARQGVLDQIDRAIEQFVNSGNATFRDRYLFSGSRSQTLPYDYHDGYVAYLGNEQNLRSHVDVDFLFDTNLPGGEVFGGTSASVIGSADLNPSVGPGDYLRHLDRGQGIELDGSIALNVATGSNNQTVQIDLSRAATLGDVARFIEEGAPFFGEVTVDVIDNRLVIESQSGADLQIAEVSNGNAAESLGIGYTGSSPVSQITGRDLDVGITKVTELSRLLGTRSVGRIDLIGDNNDIALEANGNGDFNDITVNLVDSVLSGGEVASYDALTKTLTVSIQDGVSTANQVIDAINAEGTFSAASVTFDTDDSAEAGFGTVYATTQLNVTSGGGGETLDQTSGFILSVGDESVTLDISESETVEDLLNLVEQAGLGFVAEINESQTGINVRSRYSGADFTIGENGGTTATQLGIRTYTESTQLADLNRGIGVVTDDDGDDFTITTGDGTEIAIDVTSLFSVGEVIDAINAHPDNTGLVTAQLAVTGNGIELVDTSGGLGPLEVTSSEASQAAQTLGFLSDGETNVSSPTGRLQSDDRLTLETDSVFNSLIRLRSAIQEDDKWAIGEAIERLNVDLDRLTFARSEIGARQQSLDILQARLEDEEVQLRGALSNEIDVDLVEAITNMTAKQTASQASLQTAALLMNVSLLDYL